MKKQLIILWIGIGLVVLAILFPPWTGKKVISVPPSFAGYGFLFSPPLYADRPYFTSSIEPSRLTAEILIIVLLTAGVLYTNHVASEEARKRLNLVFKFLAWGVVVIVLCVVTLICVFLIIDWQQAKKTDPYTGIAVDVPFPAPHPDPWYVRMATSDAPVQQGPRATGRR